MLVPAAKRNYTLDKYMLDNYGAGTEKGGLKQADLIAD